MTSKNTAYPTINFSFSQGEEARRLLYVATKLTRRWYTQHGFFTLDALVPSVPTSTVIFPDLPYTKIPNFWARVAKLKLTTPINAPASLITETSLILQDVYDPTLYAKAQHRLSRGFTLIESLFWQNLFALFPAYKDKISKVNIYLTQYGPISTFSLAKLRHSELTIYIRLDATIDKVLWAILTCLFRPTMETELHHTWSEVEATIDWLMRESSLNCGIPMSHPTMKNQRNDQVAKYRQKSEKYLEKLGFGHISPWQKKNNQIFYGELALSNLSHNEQILLDLLLTKRGQTATFDEIADVLWPKGKNFSLFAIAKEIERLRKKIRARGINSPLIHAQRKLGYSLL